MARTKDDSSSSSPAIPENDFLQIMNSDDDDVPPKILWSCITRNDVILAEASDVDDPSDQTAVTQTAKELLDRKPTPGFEYHTQSRLSHILKNNRLGKKLFAKEIETSSSHSRDRPLKGIKFHVYEHQADDDSEHLEEEHAFRIWVFAAVYDSTATNREEVQSFIEKIVTITAALRDDDEEWQTSGTLGLQETFAPVLQQRMEEVTYLGTVAMLQQKVHACQEQMEDNINLILERGEKIEDLSEEATHMQEMTKVFKKKAKNVRRKQMMKNAKMGLIAGTAATAAVAMAAIPLVAVL